MWMGRCAKSFKKKGGKWEEQTSEHVEKLKADKRYKRDVYQIDIAKVKICDGHRPPLQKSRCQKSVLHQNQRLRRNGRGKIRFPES
jgi:hypothetical protein